MAAQGIAVADIAIACWLCFCTGMVIGAWMRPWLDRCERTHRGEEDDD